MIQMGRANFRVTVRKPESPDAAQKIADIFYRQAVKLGLLR